jgi:signal transduction histidine kinase
MGVTGGVRARAGVGRLLTASERAREAIVRAHARRVSLRWELELANQQLQANAVELEAKTEELQSTADQLVERTREAEAARRAAVAANRLKSEFLATMSHEFRTPLNAILGYTQLLDMGVLGPATPAQHAHLARLEASARHLLLLVDDVLDVAKVDADRLEVRREPQKSGAAIAAAVALIQPQASEKGVKLSVLGADAPDFSYVGDEHRVRQILVNLLSNAVKFTGSGGRVTITRGQTTEPDPGVSTGTREVEASTTATVTDLEWAYIRVEDTGSGIPPALMGQLFEPFVQGDGALTREQGGTGLGLAISRRLARLMGGDITVRSQPGSGAIFTLWLPAPERVGEPSAADRRAAEAQPTHSSSSDRLPAAAAGSAGDVQLDDDAYAALHALSTRLSAEAETVAEHYVAALRADGNFRGARELPAVQLRDHAPPLIGLLASQLMVIGETRGTEPELLADGAQAQRLMSELHGAQRYRLGWREEDIERETSLLIAEVERAIAAGVAAATEAAGDALSSINASYLGGASEDAHGGVVISAESVSAAAQYATGVVRQALEQGVRTALRAYRFAKASDAP